MNRLPLPLSRPLTVLAAIFGTTLCLGAIHAQENYVPPLVTLSVKGGGEAVRNGTNGVVIVTRSGYLPAMPVYYRAVGTATPGVDYKLLPGVVQFAHGQAQAKIKIKAISGSTGAGLVSVKLMLLPYGIDVYKPDPTKVKIKIVDS